MGRYGLLWRHQRKCGFQISPCTTSECDILVFYLRSLSYFVFHGRIPVLANSFEGWICQAVFAKNCKTVINSLSLSPAIHIYLIPSYKNFFCRVRATGTIFYLQCPRNSLSDHHCPIMNKSIYIPCFTDPFCPVFGRKMLILAFFFSKRKRQLWQRERGILWANHKLQWKYWLVLPDDIQEFVYHRCDVLSIWWSGIYKTL